MIDRLHNQVVGCKGDNIDGCKINDSTMTMCVMSYLH